MFGFMKHSMHTFGYYIQNGVAELYTYVAFVCRHTNAMMHTPIIIDIVLAIDLNVYCSHDNVIMDQLLLNQYSK